MHRWIRRWSENAEEENVGMGRAAVDSNDLTTLEHVARDTLDAIQISIPDASPDDISLLVSKLTDYRLVDRVCNLSRGRYIRWLRPSQSMTLNRGGVIVSVHFTDKGTIVRCKSGGYFMACRFDESIVFERLTDEERIWLAAMSDTEDVDEDGGSRPD